MPNTRGTNKGVKGIKVKQSCKAKTAGRVTVKSKVVKTTVPVKRATEAELTEEENEETAYEKLLRKVQENKKRKNEDLAQNGNASDIVNNSQEIGISKDAEDMAEAHFAENDVDMIMGVTAEAEQEFLSSEISTANKDSNNNAMVGMEAALLGVQGSTSVAHAANMMSNSHGRLDRHKSGPVDKEAVSVEQSSNNKGFELMQDFLTHKGIINNLMNEEQMHDFLTKEIQSKTVAKTPQRTNPQKGKNDAINSNLPVQPDRGRSKVIEKPSNCKDVTNSPSEVTIYK